MSEYQQFLHEHTPKILVGIVAGSLAADKKYNAEHVADMALNCAKALYNKLETEGAV